MNLAKGEYTTSGFLDFLKKEYGTKTTGKEFSQSDVAQYLMRGYTPYRYGHLPITSEIISGIRIITVKQTKKKK